MDSGDSAAERVQMVGTGRGLAAGDGDSSAYLPPPVHCTQHTCHLQEWYMVTTGGTLSELVSYLIPKRQNMQKYFLVTVYQDG